MSGSYRAINFSLRSAKNIERKMMAEALLRLDRIAPLNNYRYVGFGAIFYTDFLLFHRLLGITSMLSIEQKVSDEDRFRFNLPLGCIDLDLRHSNQALPTLDWSDPTIIWLDYDEQLTDPVFADIETVAGEAAAWSVLIITVNAHPGEVGSHLKLMESNVGAERMPVDVTAEAHLAGWNFANVSRRIINAEIETVLADRNAPLPDSEKVGYRQLFNFHYADGPRMLTVGGVFYPVGEQDRLNDCSFDELAQVTDGDDAVDITVPVLTTREVLHVTAQLPAELTAVDSPGLPRKELELFARMYRYYPLFLDVDI
jgi:hypothetical protein